MRTHYRRMVWLLPIGLALLGGGCHQDQGQAPAPGQPSGYVKDKLDSPGVSEADKAKNARRDGSEQTLSFVWAARRPPQVGPCRTAASNHRSLPNLYAGRSSDFAPSERAMPSLVIQPAPTKRAYRRRSSGVFLWSVSFWSASPYIGD